MPGTVNLADHVWMGFSPERTFYTARFPKQCNFSLFAFLNTHPYIHKKVYLSLLIKRFILQQIRDYYRDLQLVKLQRISDNGVSKPN